jgi:hypothetical protein
MCDFGKDLERFVNSELGGIGSAPQPAMAFNFIRNLSATPVMNPLGDDTIVDRTTLIRYKSSGDKSYDRKWFDVMSRAGISDTAPGGKAGTSSNE